MTRKDELRRRVLLAKYPRRSAAVLNVAPDHNPLILQDCLACGGAGDRCIEDGQVAAFHECEACAGVGTTYLVVPYFSNDAPEVVVQVDADGWTKCPCCARRFSVRDPNAWTGLRHVRCGQRLVLPP